MRDVVITRKTLEIAGKQAFESGFHDIYSDIDLSVKVNFPKNGSITPEDYMKRIDRFGVSNDTALGWMFIPINKMYRIIFKSGMRYDFGFEFEYEGEDSVVLEPLTTEELEYVKELGKNPYTHKNMTFNRIADHLYAAALANDRLVEFFYPEYQGRSEDFFAIWGWYESFAEE